MSIKNIVMSAAGAGPAGDPYYDNVTLLLHGDGADNSTTAIDSSKYSRSVVSPNTGAKVTNSTSKFGAGCLQFNGSAKFDTDAEVFTSLAGLSNSFTLECWLYLTGVNGDIGEIFSMDQSGDTSGTFFYVQTDGVFGFSHAGAFNFTGISTPSASFSLNTWTHLAISKNGTTMRAFANGVQKASVTVTSANLPSYPKTYIGSRNGGGRNIIGYLDELRITNGVSRYNADFTPPSVAFPNN